MTMTLFNYFRILIVTIMLALLSNQSTWAAQANFSWLPNNTSDGTVGYMLHYGTSSRTYTESVDVGSPVPVNGRIYASVVQLAPDQTYFFTVTAYNAQGDESSYPSEVACTIPSNAVNTTNYDIYMSTSSNLSGAVALEGSTVGGDIYVFTGPDAGISSVVFSVDGVVTRTEGLAPYELAGGEAFDTSSLSSGQHKITANIQLSDGTTKLVSSLFTLSSADVIPVNTNAYDLFVTTSSNLSGAVALDGSIVEGNVYVFTGPDAGVSRVVFSVDGVVTQTEGLAPFELVGGSAFDASQLTPGQHKVSANVQLNDGSTQLVNSVFTVPSSANNNPVTATSHDIYMSTSQNLSGAIPLDGATVGGAIYVFTGPDTGVSRVVFSVDGVIARTEGLAPFELVGGSAFDTSQLSPGQHEVTANIQLSDGGTELVSAVFTIPSVKDTSVNDSIYSLLVSQSSTLSGATALDGATVHGDIYVFTGPDTGVSRVIFSIDGVVTQTESLAPFELVGGAAFNTSKLSKGAHKITALIQPKHGSSNTISASIIVK